jgi:hypothetical protein
MGLFFVQWSTLALRRISRSSEILPYRFVVVVVVSLADTRCYIQPIEPEKKADTIVLF